MPETRAKRCHVVLGAQVSTWSDSHESSAIPCTHRVSPRGEAYTCCSRATRCFCVLVHCVAVPGRLVGYANHAYTFTRTYISTTFNDASSMFRCHNGLPIYYCKSQKAWLNATLTSPRALCLNVPWWWWQHRRDLNSVARTQITTGLFFLFFYLSSLSLSLSFSPERS